MAKSLYKTMSACEAVPSHCEAQPEGSVAVVQPPMHVTRLTQSGSAEHPLQQPIGPPSAEPLPETHAMHSVLAVGTCELMLVQVVGVPIVDVPSAPLPPSVGPAPPPPSEPGVGQVASGAAMQSPRAGGWLGSLDEHAAAIAQPQRIAEKSPTRRTLLLVTPLSMPRVSRRVSFRP
jgi:hypothetical protein